MIEVKPSLKNCQPNLDTSDIDLMTNSESEYIPLDVCVIAVVILSCGTYIRSLIKSYLLAKVSIVCSMSIVCVHIYACKIMYVRTVCVYVNVYVRMYVCVCICIYVHMYERMHTNLYASNLLWFCLA